MSRKTLCLVALAGFAAGCNSSDTAKKLYGTYEVQVSAFDKMDETMAVVSQGSDHLLDFYFVYGFQPTATDTNAGLQVKLSGKHLSVEQQPIHVDLATGAEDGTVTGLGSIETSGDSRTFTLGFDVVDADAQTLHYDLSGTQTSGE